MNLGYRMNDSPAWKMCHPVMSRWSRFSKGDPVISSHIQSSGLGCHMGASTVVGVALTTAGWFHRKSYRISWMMGVAMASPISGSICCQPLLIRCEETDPAIDLLRPSSAEGIKTTPLFLRHAVTTWKGGSVGSALKGPARGNGIYRWSPRA